jgi:hypothetical protein
MTTKETLLQEIEAATDGLLIEVLNFLQGLKARWAESKSLEITDNSINSTPESVEPTSPDLANPESSAPTFEDFLGLLKDSPNFNADPVTLQQALRREWD